MRPMQMLMATAATVALAAVAGPAWAADPCAGGLGAAQIVDCLKPNGLGSATRGIRTPGSAAAQPAATTAAQPTVNLLVPFGFDSADITASGRAVLDALGNALKDPALAGARFQIAGHTDATGSADYNLALSQRRADAARDYLVNHAGIDPSRLSTIGFGSSHLYEPNAPAAAINRRVQVSRLGS